VLRNLETLARHPKHWPCLSLSNHDVVRTVTRLGGDPSGDPDLAKLLLAVLLSQRGTILLYQGEELGLPEVDLRRDQLRDPVGDLYYPIAKGRDGCRTPMPWDAKAKNLGFSTGTPWLPLGPAHRALAVSKQDGFSDSVLAYARKLLAGRKASAALMLGDITVVESAAPILAYVRRHEGESVLAIFNMSREPGEFGNAKIGAAQTLDFGCGSVEVDTGGLRLGPLSAWFGRV
jgi:alpha-glucosidase